jgi:hypothetical protein
MVLKQARWPDKRIPIYKASMEEARCGAVFPGNIVPMCRIGGKCVCFRAKTWAISGHLPVSIYTLLSILSLLQPRL